MQLCKRFVKIFFKKEKENKISRREDFKHELTCILKVLLGPFCANIGARNIVKGVKRSPFKLYTQLHTPYTAIIRVSVLKFLLEIKVNL
tara:strand:- start:67 stop:333 length:267 start_codon:yes stop_codon:yes gene_type:complete